MKSTEFEVGTGLGSCPSLPRLRRSPDTRYPPIAGDDRISGSRGGPGPGLEVEGCRRRDPFAEKGQGEDGGGPSFSRKRNLGTESPRVGVRGTRGRRTLRGSLTPRSPR